MASIEFIKKRILGKEKEIEKLNKKIERIEKAKASDWENNPYFYSERDLLITQRELKDAQSALENYQEDLKSNIEKAESRNVQVILDFLEMWKENCRDYYKEAFQSYLEEYGIFSFKSSEYIRWYNNSEKRLSMPREQAQQIENEHEKSVRVFRKRWSFLSCYITHAFNEKIRGYIQVLDEKKINRDLDQEANRKYDFIIERTNKFVGKITDASALYIGNKGDLNGWIKGTKGSAKVQTVGAGGYNVQIFHFRTIIKPYSLVR